MSYTDETAIKALKNSDDREAFTWIYNKYFHQLCDHAKILCRDSAMDIVQDFFKRLWEDRQKIHYIESLANYLHTSIHNNCLKHLEHDKVIHKYSEEVLHTSNEWDDNNDPLSMLIAQETKTAISDVIKTLPKQCRKVFVLHEEGLTHKEIASKLGISVDNVGV